MKKTEGNWGKERGTGKTKKIEMNVRILLASPLAAQIFEQ